MTSKERHEARFQRRKEKRNKNRNELHETFDDFDNVFTYSHLWESYEKCIKGVKWKPSVQRFIANAPYQVNKIYRDLHSGKYKLDKYYEFVIYERGKKRDIQSITLKDRIVHKCLKDYCLSPLIERTFIYDNGACRKGKGVKFQRDRFKHHLCEAVKRYGKSCYILQFDFRKFFGSIDHLVIKELIDKFIFDLRIRDILYRYVDSFGDIGLGLGSELSYILALTLASEIDHYCKDVLRNRLYGRYVDDGYMFLQNASEAKKVLNELYAKCNELKINLNFNKTKISPITQPFCFLKRRYSVEKSIVIVPRRETFKRATQKIKKLCRKKAPPAVAYQSYQSFCSGLNGCNCYWQKEKIRKLYDDLVIETWMPGLRI